jgi:hypothetical protein
MHADGEVTFHSEELKALNESMSSLISEMLTSGDFKGAQVLQTPHVTSKAAMGSAPCSLHHIGNRARSSCTSQLFLSVTEHLQTSFCWMSARQETLPAVAAAAAERCLMTPTVPGPFRFGYLYPPTGLAE